MKKLAVAAGIAVAVASAAPAHAAPKLWRLYDQQLKRAKYVDLTHTITPQIPVWSGFARSTFAPAVKPATGPAGPRRWRS